ncbi:hypothetical protein IW139_004469 [Coemansia sp. RSA 353]|nr:hypothetical protein EV181_002107 [Coemansia sp. RSA 532]KAJ2221856.1 hypothetical protein IW143_001656 [Coemansia sp. RSA 520]KAJ2292574.1 hypothetical protein IW139_004469 [Coemansia sp. RSA 353]
MSGRTFRQRRQRQRQHELAPNVKGRPSQDKEWVALREWCTAQGMPKSKLTLAYFPDTFRGMMATRNIEADEEMIRVPEHMLMTASKVRREVLARASDNGLAQSSAWRLSEHQALVYWTYDQRSKLGLSVWDTYVNTLPRDFSSVPLYVLSGTEPASSLSVNTDAEKWVAEHLPHSVLLKVTEQQERLFNDWTCTCEVLTKFNIESPVDWRRYVWAWLVVNTRCIHLGRHTTGNQQSAISSQPSSAVFQPISDRDSMALAPMLDLLNHNCQARVSTYFDTGRRQFVIKTLRRYCKGEEAFISYGPHDNGFMLAEYGFALAENPHCALELDCKVEMWISTVKANLNTRRARATIKSTDVDALVDVLKQHGLWGDFTLFSGSAELPYRLQAAMYLVFAAMKPGAGIKGVISQWERWQRGENTSVSEEVDLAVKNWVSRTCSEVAEHSSKLLDNIQAKQNDDARGSECLDPFLVHCIRLIWTTINKIAIESTSL